jgi:hypothetical protein
MAKTSWPEVVGWPELNAYDQITLDRPDVSHYGNPPTCRRPESVPTAAVGTASLAVSPAK